MHLYFQCRFFLTVSYVCDITILSDKSNIEDVSGIITSDRAGTEALSSLLDEVRFTSTASRASKVHLKAVKHWTLIRDNKCKNFTHVQNKEET